MRQVVLDTETTGLEPSQGHRIIEIGCVEMVNRKLTGRTYHQYINPEREIDDAAIEVHGITNEFLADKPKFAECLEDFKQFVEGSELVIHNAPFDVGFLDHEFALAKSKVRIDTICGVLDTLQLAKTKHPGQKNNLDALCRRYEIDNSHRELHGALLDSEILADVYLLMTGGQINLSLAGDEAEGGAQKIIRLDANRPPLTVLRATSEEIENHEEFLQNLDKSSGGECAWLKES